jgi:hypothetical protein
MQAIRAVEFSGLGSNEEERAVVATVLDNFRMIHYKDPQSETAQSDSIAILRNTADQIFDSIGKLKEATRQRRITGSFSQLTKYPEEYAFQLRAALKIIFKNQGIELDITETSFVFEEKVGGFHARFYEILQKEHFCDYQLHAKDKSFPCHRVLLTAASPIFAALFQKDASREYHLGSSSKCVSEMLRLIYTNQLGDSLSIAELKEIEELSVSLSLNLFSTDVEGELSTAESELVEEVLSRFRHAHYPSPQENYAVGDSRQILINMEAAILRAIKTEAKSQFGSYEFLLSEIPYNPQFVRELLPALRVVLRRRGLGNFRVAERSFLLDKNVLWSRLNELRYNEKLHDVTLITKDGTIGCHRIVLAARSPFFYRAFTSGMSESQNQKFPVQFEHIIISNVIDYIYTNELAFMELSRLIKTYECADFLQMEDLAVAALERISLQCTPDAAVELYLSAREEKQEPLAAAIRQYVDANRSKLPESFDLSDLNITHSLKVLEASRELKLPALQKSALDAIKSLINANNIEQVVQKAIELKRAGKKEKALNQLCKDFVRKQPQDSQLEALHLMLSNLYLS